MSYPAGTFIRNTMAARINHWITAACFVLLMLSGLSMFDPPLFFLSGLFGSGQWERAIHPWIGCVLLVSYAGLIVQFWRDNFWNRDDIAWMGAIVRVLRNEEEGVPEVGRFNAGQKFVFWSMALLVPVLFCTGLVIWEVYFGGATRIETQRAAELDSQLCGDRGDHHLDHPRLRCALGARLDARDDARLCDPWLGVASSSQMAAEPCLDRLARPSSSACGRGFMITRCHPHPRPLSRKGVRKDARLSTGFGERGEAAAAFPLLPRGEGGGRSPPDEGLPDEGPPASAARRS